MGVLKGADTEFVGLPSEFPCNECGSMVDLTAIISVKSLDMEGNEEVQEMSEAQARALLDTLGIPPPPVLCMQHDDAGPIVTEAL